MKVSRSFFRIGQALFSMEKLLNGEQIVHVIVYDCGTNDLTIINNAIQDISIDILYISHYHKDHILGIFHILKSGKVKKIILPMLTDSEKLICVEYCRSNNFSDLENENIQRFIWAPVQYIHNKLSSFTEVNFATDDSNNKIPLKGDENNEDEEIFQYVAWHWNIHLLTPVEVNKFVVLFNKSKENNGKITIKDINDIAEDWEKYNISSIVRDVMSEMHLSFEQINEYSMTLYTGFLDTTYKLGCLYLGDFNAKKNFEQLHNIYRSVWDKIKIVQIPHHGSIKNFNDNLVDKEIVAIIPNGKSHRGKEIDSSKTKKKCLLKKCVVVETKDGDYTSVFNIDEIINTNLNSAIAEFNC